MLIFYKLGGKGTLKSNSLRNNFWSLFQKLLEGDKQHVCISLVSLGNQTEDRRSQKSWTSGKLLVWYGRMWELENIFTSNISEESKATQFLFIQRIGYLTFSVLYSKWKTYLFTYNAWYLDLQDRYNFSWCFPSPSTKRRKQIDKIDHSLFLIIDLNGIKIWQRLLNFLPV